MGAPLAVGDNRLHWSDLPAPVASAILDRLGSPVVSADSRPGGFSPGLASVLRLADGRSVFIKAVGAERNPVSPVMHRQEARVLAALPPEVPAPRLLWTYDDGDWVVIATEALAGTNPAQPWRPDELAAYLAVAERLVETLTPSPIEAPTIQEYYVEDLTGWRTLASGPAPAALDPWTAARLDRLAGIEAGWPVAAVGNSLLHADLRADNVVLTPAGPMVVDWPHACIGAGWIDVLFAVPSIVMHGGGDPAELWAGFRPGRAADPEAVTALLTAVTGYFVHSGLKPAMPNFPTIRAFQWAQGQAGLDWLRRLLA